jgi:RNA polymerase sigma factor (sigma-70 family)
MWIHLPEHMFLARDPALADQGECHGGDNVEDCTDASPTQRHAPRSSRRNPTRTTEPRRPSGRKSDQEIARLVARAADGDQRAWNALEQQFGGLVWAIARAHRLGDADAAEVAQLTWLRLVEHLADLNKPGYVGAWLATTARRESLRVLRHAQRHVLTDDDDVFDRESADPVLDSGLLTAERDDALWRTLARLPLRDRVLLRLLTSSDAPSYEEIALALNMPIGSIGPTRARALERLRRGLLRDGTLAWLID